MSTIKTVLTTIEKKKDKIAKFFILCSGVEFFISTMYRICNVKDSRKQEETLINVYSLITIMMICFHEIFSCLFCQKFEENFKIFTHYTGKGIITLLVSFIYMSPSLGQQQNYSALMLFASGIICLIADYNFSKGENKVKSAFELALENSKTGQIKVECEISETSCEKRSNDKIEVVDLTCANKEKKSDNPYDVLEDF